MERGGEIRPLLYPQIREPAPLGKPLSNPQAPKAPRGDEERIMHEARERSLQSRCSAI